MFPSVAAMPRTDARAAGWFAKMRGVVGFAATQALVQGIGFFVGLALVRLLPVDDYALYALAVSMVGLCSVLLDLGLGAAVLARGGPLSGVPARLAALAADAFVVHRRMVWTLLPLLAAGFAVMFAVHHAAPGRTVVMTLLVACCAALQVRSGLVLPLLRLHGEWPLQQRMDLAVNAGKALLVALLAMTALNSALALAANIAAALGMWLWLRRWLSMRLPGLPPASGEFRRPLLELVRQQAPNSIYYCLSGQITIWLVAVLGTTQGVAEVGALGRIAVVFTIVGAVMAAIGQPHFARQRDPRRALATFVLLNLLFGAATLALALSAAAFPHHILWILGGSYQTLQQAVPWMVLAACLSAWSGAIYSIGSARGFLVPAPWVIGTGVLSVAACAIWLDVARPVGSFQMSTVISAVATLLCLLFVTLKLRRDAVATGGTS